MADNVPITAGSGTNIATDDVSGIQYQRVKITDGTPDSSNHLVVDSLGRASVVTRDITGNASLVNIGDQASIELNSHGTVAVTIYGTWVGAATFQVSHDGSNWFNINGNITSSTNTFVNGLFTANGGYQFGVAGWRYFRIIRTVATSGTIQLFMSASLGSSVVNPSAVQPVSLATGSNTVGNVGGVDASGATVTGNPVLSGARAATTNPTAVSDGQAIAVMTDKVGRVVTVPFQPRALMGKQATTLTSSTSATTVVTAGGSGVFTDITSLTITNSSSTATIVTLTDGTTAMTFSLAAGPGSGFTKEFSSPLYATTANTAWTLQCGTSVASVYCNIIYAKNT